jgi:minor extracellular serine protease Vpr
MKRLSGALVAFVAVVLTTAVAGATAGGGSVSDLGSTAPSVDTNSASVQLNGDPLSTSYKTKPPRGKKIDFSSSTVKSYRAQLSALRNDVKQWLKANAPEAKVTGGYDTTRSTPPTRMGWTSST